MENIQRAVVRLLCDEIKRNSLVEAAAAFQIVSRLKLGWYPYQFTRGQTWLHIAAKEGLATFSEIIFERALDRYDRYVLVLSAIQLKIGHIIQY